MMWVDYTVESIGSKGEGFRVNGDWPGEVMGIKKDGTPNDHYLYRPGDVFVVNENGWLQKSDELTVFILKGLKKREHSDTNPG
jgi:hypothetical protein